MSGYIKVPWTFFEDNPWTDDDHLLAAWLRAELEAARAKSLRHRPTLSRMVWQRILETFGYRCVYCGAGDVPLQREHVIPYSKGGRTDETNIVPACEPCNRKKGTQVWSVG